MLIYCNSAKNLNTFLKVYFCYVAQIMLFYNAATTPHPFRQKKKRKKSFPVRPIQCLPCSLPLILSPKLFSLVNDDKVHFCVYRTLPLDHIQSQMNPLHTLNKVNSPVCRALSSRMLPQLVWYMFINISEESITSIFEVKAKY